MLGDHFFGVAAVIVVASVALAIPLALLLRRRPALAARLRRQAAPPTLPCVVGPAGRVVLGVVGGFCVLIAALGGWVMWSSPDLALFAGLWVLPSAYIALTALWIAASGRSDGRPDGSIFWLVLWPW